MIQEHVLMGLQQVYEAITLAIYSHQVCMIIYNKLVPTATMGGIIVTMC